MNFENDTWTEEDQERHDRENDMKYARYRGELDAYRGYIPQPNEEKAYYEGYYLSKT